MSTQYDCYAFIDVNTVTIKILYSDTRHLLHWAHKLTVIILKDCNVTQLRFEKLLFFLILRTHLIKQVSKWHTAIYQTCKPYVRTSQLFYTNTRSFPFTTTEEWRHSVCYIPLLKFLWSILIYSLECTVPSFIKYV